MTTKLLDRKVVIVTGGSRGIGRALAIESEKHGADVVVNYFGENDLSYGHGSAIDVTPVLSSVSV